MTDNPLERTIEQYLCKEVKKLGGVALKWNSLQHRGVPDRIVFIPNIPPIFIEVKRKTGKLTLLQKYFIHVIEKSTPYMYVVYSKQDIDLILSLIKTGS